MMRLGIISELGSGENLGYARVSFDEVGIVSGWLALPSAGTRRTKQWTPLEVNTQVACLMDDRCEQGVIVMALWSSADMPPEWAGAETIDVQALPAGAAASTAVDNTDMEAAMRALLGSIHHFSDGRVRLRHPLFRESSTFGALHTLLCEGTGIRDATFNAATGSALLTYDPGQTSRKEFLQQALPLGACLLEWEARHS